MTLKAVLFDLDGTLLDTAPDFVTSLNALRKEENLQPLAYASIRAVVSNGARALVELGFGLQEVTPDFERLRIRLLELYGQHLAEQTRPFDGINQTIEYLAQQKLQWGVVTNKPWQYTEPLLAEMKFPADPATVICPDHVTHRKPHPEPMLLACKKLACRPPDAIYIGDHRRDIESGRNAGLKTIACSYGYIEDGDIIADWRANHVVEHAADIIPVLQSYL